MARAATAAAVQTDFALNPLSPTAPILISSRAPA
jgi:hypothetical protein